MNISAISPADFARFYLSASVSIFFLILAIFKAFYKLNIF